MSLKDLITDAGTGQLSHTEIRAVYTGREGNRWKK